MFATPKSYAIIKVITNEAVVTIIKLKESPKNCIPKGADHPPKSSVIGR